MVVQPLSYNGGAQINFRRSKIMSAVTTGVKRFLACNTLPSLLYVKVCENDKEFLRKY